MDFDTAFATVVGNEGGYVDDPQDPGGETNWGISKRSYPDLDIKGLTKEAARLIYMRDFWTQCGAPRLPSIAFPLFDMAVNSGVKRAIMTLQAAVGCAQDGVLGPMTIAAAQTMSPYLLAAKFYGTRLKFLTYATGWEHDGKGWARRIADGLNAIGT